MRTSPARYRNRSSIPHHKLWRVVAANPGLHSRNWLTPVSICAGTATCVAFGLAILSIRGLALLDFLVVLVVWFVGAIVTIVTGHIVRHERQRRDGPRVAVARLALILGYTSLGLGLAVIAL